VQGLMTGKGPLKAFYEQKIETLKLQHVQIVTVWLRAEDYPVLIGYYLFSDSDSDMMQAVRTWA
jgi:hypothetical protein